ncbi:MAG TPA: flavin reductase family protein [Chitinophagaceae bacterium]|nr:flavin reductase family protein [Chitinophagaceae bacterium]
MTLDFSELTTVQKQYYLQHVIAPRPICLASTINQAGEVNLSPFSFFNLFSSQPPILIFSPSRRVRDNTTKHTLHNVREVPEVVIHVVTRELVEQVSLASCDYPAGVNEFGKAGFTQEPATLVRPPMVAESPVKLECRVLEIKSLGEQAGSGNLVICEVLRLHLRDSLLDAEGNLDPRRLHLAARLGGDWYCDVTEQNLFQVEKPNTRLGIGVDSLPDPIRHSRILSGRDLGRLANVSELPGVDPAFQDDHLRQIIQYFSVNPEEMEAELHRYAKKLLDRGLVREAWQVLLAGG